MGALYIPPAVNMLIPRGTIGGAGQQPIIWPIGVILHTNASNTSLAGAASLMKYTTKGQEYHCQQEAPGVGRIAGRLGQYVDFTIRADNNYRGNSFMYQGRLAGYISIETADHGSPYEKSWTDLGQRQNLEDLCVWLCRNLHIPARRCPDPFSPGIGYHSMWGYNTSSNMNVNPWTNAVGKICPGPGKIREFPDLLAAVARRVTGGEPTTPRRKPVGYIIDVDGQLWVADSGPVWKRRVSQDAGVFAFTRATASLAGSIPVNVNAGTTTEQGDKRDWFNQIATIDPTADDATLTVIGANAAKAASSSAQAVLELGKKATTEHLTRVEQQVNKIPTTPGTGGFVPHTHTSDTGTPDTGTP